LGRGLSALIPEEDFPDVKQDEAVEADVDVRSDIDMDVGADIGTAVEPSAEVSADVPAEGSVPEDVPVSSAADSLKDDSWEIADLEVGGLPISDAATGDVPAGDSAADDLPPLAADDLVVDDAAAGDVPAGDSAADDLPVPAADDLVVDDAVTGDVPAEDSAADDLPVPAADDLETGDLPVNDMALKDLWSNNVAANDVPTSAVGDSVEQGVVLENNFVVQLAIDRLVPNPGQPRKNFDETELQELADSIKEHGVIMPIIAADTGGDNFTIIAGERRTRAARLAGLAEVPVIIRNYTDQKRMEISLIENIQRSDLNPIEEATAFKNLMDFSGISQEEVAARVGKNRSTVTNALRLLRLSAEVQKSLETGEISAGHARALLSVTDDKLRDKLFKEITAKGFSVREAEKKAVALNTAGGAAGAEGAEKEKAKRPPEITEMEEKFIEKLGTKVSISGGLEKGLIRIEYYSMEDLDRLYGLLG
jgi:ParB family chromosome partitioning protein